MVQFLLLCSALTLSSCVGNFLRESPAFARELQELPIIDDIVVTDPDLSTLAVAFQAAELVGMY
jgi:hypothetical protein